MLLWTIQHRSSYDEMMLRGSLRANEDHLFCENDFREQYDWIAQQLTIRVSPPPQGIKYPVWAWYKCEGKRKRPDMRSHAWHWCNRKGTPIVLLTVDIPDNLVLLSDFDRWNIVLNGQYLSKDEDDDAESNVDACVIRKSWKRIFDLSPSEYWGRCDTVQAIMWEIKQEWVLKTEFFSSR